MRVCVVGTGHVGLVTCASLAAVGHEVVGVDSDEAKIEQLKSGDSPFFEPGLPELVEEGLRSQRLRFSTQIADGAPEAEIVFICVGTPPRESGEANLVAVENATREVMQHLSRAAVIVEKSTVPAGTSERIRRTLQRERPDLAPQVDVVSNPEFLREGKAVEDATNPDRILIGADGERAFVPMRELYKPWIDRGVPVFETNIATAELAKHACNAFLSTKISFVNALARLCERAGADVVAVADVMGADDRIGRQFLNAGLGYGGYCFPKDLLAFERLASRLGYEFGLLREVATINDDAVRAAVEKVKDALWNMEDKRIAVLGLAFKPDTDDIRLSPSLALARQLLDEGAHVVGYDPVAGLEAKGEIPDLEVVNTMWEACEGAHCVVIATDWQEFKDADLERLRSTMAYPVVVDGRNIYEPAEMNRLGFTYYPTGRPVVS
ncbi:MAG TPA: UDP-glucose/GDP-mannose dehydrogenase family protein [Actinomycetota bacterium]|nr:UDP-glucose/GDP-mannose dehydrogenase family protein [Actinomycetota bacterium]